MSYENGNFNLNGNENVNIRPLAPSNLEGDLKIENETGNFNLNLNGNENGNVNFNVKKSETSVASV